MRKEVPILDFAYFSNIDKKSELAKFASTYDVVSTIKQKAEEAFENRENPKNVVFIGLAVTAWEWYGPNDNGDSFHESPIGGALTVNDTLLARYSTFEDGHAFKYHQSGDTDNAIGKIHYAYYNTDQHRVELVVEIFRDKAPSECRKLRKGKSLNISMGCSVVEDACSICSHKAKTADEHCDHIKYHLLEIIDGIPVYMINIKPTFFDISIVIIPGDMCAKVMDSISD